MPEGLRNWKEKEKRWYARLVQGMHRGIEAVRILLVHAASWLRTRVVIALIPQSEKPSRRLEISHLGLLSLCLIAAVMLGGAVISLSSYGIQTARAVRLSRELAEAHRNIDRMRDKTEELLAKTAKFQETLGIVVDIAQGRGKQPQLRASDEVLKAAGLSDLLSGLQVSDPISRDLLRLDGVASSLEQSIPSLEIVANVLAGQKDILTEVPNIWPVKNNLGHITMYFGQNENPFSTGQWYLHTGIDISTNRVGDPILATADGKVIDVHYDPSLGNSVTIQHSHGFTTRYGHLRSFAVKKGQKVSQGDVIGWLGNTGRTTGPHLHYEVYLGTSLIDPLRFLSIRKEFHE